MIDSILNTYKRKNIFLLFILVFSISAGLKAQSTEWVVPEANEAIVNPLAGNNDAVKEGAKISKLYCAICHGNKGKGNGVAGMSLNPKPTNFQSDQFQKQSDGAIFWKLTTGRPPMAPYKDMLTEDQRWKLVTYLRSLSKD